MRTRSVTANARRKAFDVVVPGKAYTFPYARCTPRPSGSDPVVEVFVDAELANGAFTYRLRHGGEGSVHVEQVRDFNKDPSYLRDLLVYRLTLEAQRRVAETSLSKREIVRRMEPLPRSSTVSWTRGTTAKRSIGCSVS